MILKGYHGSTFDFDKFQTPLNHKSNYLGAFVYLSDSKQDAVENYSKVGFKDTPDFDDTVQRVIDSTQYSRKKAIKKCVGSGRYVYTCAIFSERPLYFSRKTFLEKEEFNELKGVAEEELLDYMDSITYNEYNIVDLIRGFVYSEYVEDQEEQATYIAGKSLLKMYDAIIFNAKELLSFTKNVGLEHFIAEDDKVKILRKERVCL